MLAVRSDPRSSVTHPGPLNAGHPKLWMYFTILQGIQAQIRFADAKAAFLTALNVILFGFLALRFDSVLVAYARAGSGGAIFMAALALQACYLSATAAAIAAVVLSVMPRFAKLAPRSKLFFGPIAEEYGTDWPRYVRDLGDLSDDQWAEQIGLEIVEVSHIAVAKHRLMRRAAWLTLLAFVLWRLSLAAIAFLPTG
ncbi:MAG TPA: Pycsar system effector family protein [Pirellulales bacterium]|nr:Pycsar system effector family protein [Pirellulales bacterium]